MKFRKATLNDIQSIVAMLADDKLGEKQENYKTPLPKGYYHAFENIVSDKNQELMVV